MQLSTYSEGVERLKKRLRGMSNTSWSPTPEYKKLHEIATALVSLADELDGCGVAQSSIESEHDKVQPPLIGADGWPIPAPDYGISFKATLMYMRELAGSAKSAASKLPNPRSRAAIPFAALAFVHLKYWYEHERPKLTNDGKDVQELSEICESAGILRSPENMRNALSDALKIFDRHFYPPGILNILTGENSD